MKRYLDEIVAADLRRKMVLLTGPRQVGKTTLCRHLTGRSAASCQRTAKMDEAS